MALQYICNDCGIDVLEVGDWFMATPKIWEEQLGLVYEDNLCLPCLDKRLGRKAEAFTDILPTAETSVRPKASSYLFLELFEDHKTLSKRASSRYTSTRERLAKATQPQLLERLRDEVAEWEKLIPPRRRNYKAR
jgi:hypothetical protein